MIKKTIASLIILAVFTLMISPINLIVSDSTISLSVAEVFATTREQCIAAGRVWIDPDGEGPLPGSCRDDPITRLARQILAWAQTLFAIVAIGAILLGAFMFITASGDESKLKTGRNSILFALIAVFIVAITGWLIAWFQGIAG